MSETREFYKALKAINDAERAEIRDEAWQQYAEASAKAEKHGFELKVCSYAHYQLKTDDWIINLYPGNGRIFADKNQKAKAPFLKVPTGWTLMDVVDAAITTTEKQS